MRFTRELPANVNLIRGHAAAEIRIGDQTLRRSFLLSATELIADWTPHSVDELTPEVFADALAWQPEIFLLGTGTRQIFPAREIYSAMLTRGVGFEVMDTGAACRTFNVLVGESRRVAAGFLIDAKQK
jgi:uncharacterized protein